jgi:transposase
MDNYIAGCDVHKHYSLFGTVNLDTRARVHTRVEHAPGTIRSFLAKLPPGTPVALETVGNWYWIVDEIEAAGCLPLMANAGKAKVMMGNVDKTDKLDVDGLLTLLQTGTLPTVWLPPGPVRDARELHRTRMALCKERTGLKNRVQATLAKYALSIEDETDIFCGKGRKQLELTIQSLPPETQRCVQQELQVLDYLQKQIHAMEKRIRECVKLTPTMQSLKTLPGVGDILAILIALEMGSAERFARAEQFCSYCGTVPKVKSSGGVTHYGHTRQECNHYLKWAFFEAANVAARHHKAPSWRDKHIVRLYERVRKRKGHGVAIGAVARHLSEAAYAVVLRNEPYREPDSQKNLPKQR